ncbi:MAG: hypothetical protein M3541_19120 [Acidobacteriota bacterium]|jgi:hypothetical protein|nr:hypothetical protein [Acidobacteriota bacterium]
MNDDYNYSTFEGSVSEFLDFAVSAPKVTMRAPSFGLEDLSTGQRIELSDLWTDAAAVLEFGSFT